MGRHRTHHLHALKRQERPLVGPGAPEERFPIRGRAHFPWVSEENPDRVERDGEEVSEEENWGLRDAGNADGMSKMD